MLLLKTLILMKVVLNEVKYHRWYFPRFFSYKKARLLPSRVRIPIPSLYMLLLKTLILMKVVLNEVKYHRWYFPRFFSYKKARLLPSRVRILSDEVDKDFVVRRMSLSSHYTSFQNINSYESGIERSEIPLMVFSEVFFSQKSSLIAY